MIAYGDLAFFGAFKSNHKYDLKKFGITEEQIKNDCQNIYSTFLSGDF